jgi:hypothetical protein
MLEELTVIRVFLGSNNPSALKVYKTNTITAHETASMPATYVAIVIALICFFIVHLSSF